MYRTSTPPAPLLLAALLLSACGPGTLRPFTTDGCSMFPDQSPVRPVSWERCCVVHDMAYWRGGTEGDRLEADRALQACVVAETHDPVLGEAMFRGVRAGGSPHYATTYRWGYGWSHERPYAPLTAQERRVTDDGLRAWLAAHPDAPRPPWPVDAAAAPAKAP